MGVNFTSIEIEQPDEEGFGNIVVTNLLRKRFPLLRYLIGDIGKLSLEDGRPTLHLKSRENKSFTVYPEAYLISDFDNILKQVDHFQI